jgi:hypothetical protein
MGGRSIGLINCAFGNPGVVPYYLVLPGAVAAIILILRLRSRDNLRNKIETRQRMETR